MEKILVVDDAVFMRGTLKVILERNGYIVVGEADSGKSALKKYMELKPDIVTLDITMPEMDGVSALREIRKIDPSSKIIMISDFGQQVLVKEAIEHGARGFFTKPFKEHQVLSVLKEI